MRRMQVCTLSRWRYSALALGVSVSGGRLGIASMSVCLFFVVAAAVVVLFLPAVAFYGSFSLEGWAQQLCPRPVEWFRRFIRCIVFRTLYNTHGAGEATECIGYNSVYWVKSLNFQKRLAEIKKKNFNI